MWFLGMLIVLSVVAVALWIRRTMPRPQPRIEPHSRRQGSEAAGPIDDLHADVARVAETDAERLLLQLEDEVERDSAQLPAEPGRNSPASPPRDPQLPEALALHDHGAERLPQQLDGPSWMSPEERQQGMSRYREQSRSEREITQSSASLEQRGQRPRGDQEQQIVRSEKVGIVTRSVYVPREEEARYLTRDEDGLPTLRLVDAGDRLAIWSPLYGGALINPKGQGLRTLGLSSSYGRGSAYHASAYRTADLRKGRWVELRREPDNTHDKNAIAMFAARARKTFGYVQKGRAPAIAKRIDAGEDIAGVTLWGPGRGSVNNTTFVIIGDRVDLTAMLDG